MVTISRREYDNSIVLLDSSKTDIEWCPLIFYHIQQALISRLMRYSHSQSYSLIRILSYTQ
jgi:hypothetical protein